jgi:uncharacterized protein YkwD
MWKIAAAAVAAAALGMPAAASAAACPGADSAPAQLGRREQATAVLCLLNGERGGRGLPALRLDRRLSVAARRHSADMVAQGYFEHTSRSGASFVSRIAATGWTRNRSSWRVAEDLAWGTGARATPAGIVAAWMASPPHRRAILGPYRSVGIGVALGVPVSGAGGGDGATYTADFGS